MGSSSPTTSRSGVQAGRNVPGERSVVAESRISPWSTSDATRLGVPIHAVSPGAGPYRTDSW
ncbi:hypothetical protein [Nocardia sp. NPDC003963]